MADYQEKFRDKPMFFRTLTHGFGERLEIPTAFVKNIVPEKIATVWDPLGKPWSFRIQRDFPNFYFKEGWQSFAAAYNLEIGCSLLFCYEGDMDFSVILFDTSSCRKESFHLNREEQVQDAIQKDESMMINTEKTPYTGVQSVAMKLACILRRNVDGSTTLVRISENKITVPGQRISREWENSSCEKDIGVKKIEAKIIDLEDYVEGVDRNSSEYEYYQKIKNTRTENVCLEEDRLKRVDGISKDSEHDSYVKGVELMRIEKDDITVEEGKNLECAVNTDQEDNITLLAATKLHRTCGIRLTERPSFWITISHFCLKIFQLPIPNAFVAARNMSVKRRATIRDQNGNIFTMTLGHTTRNRTLLTNGWKKFSVESNLKLGDICEFTCECDEDENQETEALQVRVLKEPPSWYEKPMDSMSRKNNKKRKR